LSPAIAGPAHPKASAKIVAFNVFMSTPKIMPHSSQTYPSAGKMRPFCCASNHCGIGSIWRQQTSDAPNASLPSGQDQYTFR
jgi:hypothetical protein